MPLKKIPLPSGFDKNDTASQAEGRWIDGDNIRFQYGSPEKIGGWQQINTSISIYLTIKSYLLIELVIIFLTACKLKCINLNGSIP